MLIYGLPFSNFALLQCFLFDLGFSLIGEVEALLPVIAMLLQFSPEEVNFLIFHLNSLCYLNNLGNTYKFMFNQI